MHGQIISFDDRMASGTLRCSKGQQYDFSEREWKGELAPQPGQRVSFMPIGQHATGVQPSEQARTTATVQPPQSASEPLASQPAASVAAPTLSSLAVISLVAGIIGLFFFGSLIAIICGHIARSQIRRSQGQLTGDGLAIAGLVMGYFALGLTLLFALGLASAFFIAG